MTENQNAVTHADQADIVRWLDGALPMEERRALEVHLASCAECAATHRTLSRRSVHTSNLLRAVDVPAPATAVRLPGEPRARTRTRGERWLTLPQRWRIAAGLVFALAGGAAVLPVRAWVTAFAKSAWALASGAGSGHASASPHVAAPGAVAFTPAGTVLTIRVPARADASLTLEVVEGDQVSAVGSQGQALPGLLVLPNELRIDDRADPMTDFLVRVPFGLKTVRIMIGATREEAFRPSAIGERKTISLTP